MLRSIGYAVATAALITAITTTVVGQTNNTDQTVYQMADGVIRPSQFPGADAAYLPIDANSNHAANLLALPNGDLLCFWFAGTWEGQSNVSIAMSRLDKGSHQWTEPLIVSTHAHRSDQNPVPFLAPDGRVWLFHTSQAAGKGQTTSVVYQQTSDDQGHTWSEAQEIFPLPGSYVRQHLVIFHDEWLFPTYRSASAGITTNAENDISIVKISKDSGKTWSDCEVPASGGLVQMNIVKISESNLIAFFRSRYGDWIYRSASSDGCHWSPPVATQLPNNNASIQAIRLKDGHLVMAFNNTQATTTRDKPRTAGREILSVALSEDGGATWPWVRDVQAGPTPPAINTAESAAYAYPSVFQTDDGKIQMAFTFRRETIKYMTFDESWIKQGTTTVGIFKGDPKP
jgi:predicted neuraminidase